MSHPFQPVITPAIWAMRPDFAALSIVAETCSNGASPAWVTDQLAVACRESVSGPDWAAAHLAAWQDAFRSFGAKPQRTPCSAEALRKRAGKGEPLPSINAVVDLYNAVSIAFAIPAGGEDVDRYIGQPQLTIADGTEPFETIKEGQPGIEHPDKGEVIWRDNQGVTCRRWNWRQGPRTRIDADTRTMWFLLERLEPMPLAALQRAGETLCRDLERLSPGVKLSQRLYQIGNATG